jgi:3-dehydroquinate synthase
VPEVSVDVGTHQYTIYIAPGSLTHIGQRLSALGEITGALVVTNPIIRQNYGELLTDCLVAAGYTVECIELPPGEATKSMEWAMRLYDHAIAMGLDRKSCIIALGGGVIGDLAGFVAATYMRGVPFVQVPTTLLAQVDSSVGGKVAINHPQGKNLIGAFYQPNMVLIDPLTLNTLPQREWLSGMAEVIKYGIIADTDFFDVLSQENVASLSRNSAKIGEIIKRSCEIKAAVVNADEKETGLRMILNFGHTIGHALESATGYTRYTHGEAVAIGMVGAAMLARDSGWLDTAKVECIRSLIQQYQLPVHFNGIDINTIVSHLYHDKKKEGGAIRWVLPRSIGQVAITKEVSEEQIRAVLADLST